MGLKHDWQYNFNPSRRSIGGSNNLLLSGLAQIKFPLVSTDLFQHVHLIFDMACRTRVTLTTLPLVMNLPGLFFDKSIYFYERYGIVVVVVIGFVVIIFSRDSSIIFIFFTILPVCFCSCFLMRFFMPFVYRLGVLIAS